MERERERERCERERERERERGEGDAGVCVLGRRRREGGREWGEGEREIEKRKNKSIESDGLRSVMSLFATLLHLNMSISNCSDNQERSRDKQNSQPIGVDS